MKRVSVLFALTSPVRGGIEEVVLALARRLDRRWPRPPRCSRPSRPT